MSALLALEGADENIRTMTAQLVAAMHEVIGDAPGFQAAEATVRAAALIGMAVSRPGCEAAVLRRAVQMLTAMAELQQLQDAAVPVGRVLQ